ncbi:MAG: type II toxin-antitoxin system mRNA interferase toxin, RelE/StbE family [Candidatus Omnitrophica bacterium]|nr:type II toxin-antitoxin system mRNA interferase toxin, RelE/StbE family [Candidatus Omnitrophota bacterium]
MEIRYTKKFEREYKSIDCNLKLKTKIREALFRKNPFNNVLKTHKLWGNLADFWVFSVDFKNRIIFEFLDEKTVMFHSVGGHDIYR